MVKAQLTNSTGRTRTAIGAQPIISLIKQGWSIVDLKDTTGKVAQLAAAQGIALKAPKVVPKVAEAEKQEPAPAEQPSKKPKKAKKKAAKK